MLVAGLVFSRRADPIVGVAAGVALGLLLARAAIIWIQRGRLRSGLDREAALKWERRYGLTCVAFAATLGLFISRALATGDLIVDLLVTGLLYGYCSGVVARLSIRPLICISCILVAACPAAFAVASQGIDAAPADGFGYAAHALLILLFAVGSLETVVQTYQAVAQQLLTNLRLADLARHDALTGLPNRLVLRERFDDTVVRLRPGGSLLAIHFLDLDRFKPVNDRYGHPTGDALLRAVASRLSSTLRKTDTAVRLGGDEFAVVQTSIAAGDEARMLANRLIKALSAPYQIDGHTITIGVSIGIAMAPRDGVDLALLSERADAALYMAKSRGRGVVSCWEDGAPQLSAVA